MPYTSGQLRALYQDRIAPGDNGAFYALLGEADQRLLEMSNWRWTRDVVSLTPDANHIITLPAGYSSIIAARMDNIPADVVWEDFEYYVTGPGEIRIDGGDGRLVDRGTNDSDEREYFVSLSDVDAVSAMLKKSPVGTPEDDSLEMVCPQATALKQMMMAIIFEDNNDIQKHSEWRMLAKATLTDHEMSYRGAAKQVFKHSLSMPLPRRSRSNFP